MLEIYTGLAVQPNRRPHQHPRATANSRQTYILSTLVSQKA